MGLWGSNSRQKKKNSEVSASLRNDGPSSFTKLNVWVMGSGSRWNVKAYNIETLGALNAMIKNVREWEIKYSFSSLDAMVKNVREWEIKYSFSSLF